jgi:AmpD protein
VATVTRDVVARRRHHPGMRGTTPDTYAIRRLEVDSLTGRIAGARQVVSPNCDDRPDGAPVDLVIVHGISLPPGEFGGPWIDALFTNALPPDLNEYFAQVHSLRVSAHAMIRRSGEVVQYVDVRRRAWHAGRSQWQGRENCNDFSIGIELEGTDAQAYESAQYVVLARLIAALCRVFPGITPDRVVGHSDVAPGRKTDPGIAFDWPMLRTLLRFELEVHAR